MSQAKVKQITIYPIKSSAGLEVANSQVEPWGLAFDRRFVLTDMQGDIITARTDNRLCLISVKLANTGLQLNAPGMPELIIRYDDLALHYKTIHIWGNKVSAQYCSINYNLWFSGFLGRSCQLYFFGEQSIRQVENTESDVSFADAYPILLLSQASLDDLNSRTDSAISMARFRPNIVVDDCLPFAEDGWKNIKIGDVEFEIHSPCARCVFTTINPLTAEKHQLLEPLATLQKYRKDANGEVMFGQYLIALNQGDISIDDPVTLIRKQKTAIYVNNAPMIKGIKGLTLKCTKVIQETHDVKTFELQTTDPQSVSYIAGQHLPIELLVDDKTQRRCYTLSSSPTRETHLSITVKMVDGGLVSNYLHENFQVGSELKAQAPAGKFHLNNAKSSKILLLSAGSGITPMLSMLRAMTDKKSDNDIVFFHSAKNEQDLIAEQEIARLASQHGRCRVIYTLTRAKQAYLDSYIGYINQTMLADIADITEREVFFCGPSKLRDMSKSLLMDLGLPPEQFHFESFGEGVASNALINVNEPAKEVSILFDSWNTIHQGNNKQTLLEQAEFAGISLPYSCRAGICGTCKVKLTSGEVQQLVDMGGLSAQEQKQGYVLACLCMPITDVVITSS